MKPTAQRNFFVFSAILKMARHFLTIFRFTEADAGCILLAYGLHGFALEQLQDNRSNEKEETRVPLPISARLRRKGGPAGPIPLGIHPDFICGNWRSLKNGVRVSR
jgi:hypothetical protein